jgi:hypothetical protein
MKKIKNLFKKLGKAYIKGTAEVYGPMIMRRF